MHADAWNRVMMPTYGTPRLLLARGSGARVEDAEGRTYLDFLAGIAVSTTGHAHPRVVTAISEQAARLLHTSNLYANAPALRLAERLTGRTGYDRVFFANSGGEANEFALKLVRRHGNRRGERHGVILAAQGSFHGRTLATVTLTGQPKYHRDFDPLPAGFVHVPFNDVAALERAFAEHPVLGVFLEPVQGEGGVRPATPAYLEAARRLCDAHDALLVLDEVQTGVGRTGRFLAQEHAGVRADVTTLAKGLASGIPLGAALVRETHANLLGPGDHGSTFGGNPVAAAAALATLDVLDEGELVDRAHALGALLRDALKDRVPGVRDVRGLGLLAAVEFEAPIARDAQREAERCGLLVGTLGEHALRLAPPLVVTEVDVKEAVGILEKAAASALAAMNPDRDPP